MSLEWRIQDKLLLEKAPSRGRGRLDQRTKSREEQKEMERNGQQTKTSDSRLGGSNVRRS